MGCVVARDDECNRQERPRHEVELDTFYIDRTEVTVDDYRKCHDAGGCSIAGLGSQIDVGGLQVDCNWGKEGKASDRI
ncbi:MAG: SUMF1/EgtB/PvdO family nonheme iron enzyme [Myxococcales bacterium]|nr:SUMF1/EgtB/PvdO family nonheme iron enzyme [Myxococcales bacterium]